MQLAPERLRQRLVDLRSRGDGLSENGLGVGDVEPEHDRGAADRGRREHPHLRELVGHVQHTGPDAQLHGHQPPVGDRDTVEFLGAEGVAVELCGAFGILDHDMRRD